MELFGQEVSFGYSGLEISVFVNNHIPHFFSLVSFVRVFCFFSKFLFHNFQFGIYGFRFCHLFFRDFILLFNFLHGKGLNGLIHSDMGKEFICLVR